MNRQEIIDIAIEAGFRAPTPSDGCMGLAFDFRDGTDTGASLEKFAALVAAKERERLASDVELPEPTYIYHYDPAAEAGEDELFEVGFSGRVDLECPHCNPLYTADQLRDYGDRRATAERDVCAITAVIHSQYPITTEYDRGFDAGSKRAADAIRARGQS